MPAPASLNLIALAPEETIARLRALGVTEAQARKILSARVLRGEADTGRVDGISRALRAEIEATTTVPRLRVLERRVDPADGFAKYLLETHDGYSVEAVRIPLLPGPDGRQRFTLCISSEAGCAMGCRFCATAAMGRLRPLESWEMVAQVLAVRDEAPGPVTGVVFMGMGEPFANFERVIAATETLSHPLGLAIQARRITISTVGLVPEIRRFTALSRRMRLAVSLFSAIEEKRRAWVPIARKHDLASLRAALVEHGEAGGRPLVAITMIRGVNDSVEDGRAAATFCRGLPCTIDLIEVNDSTGRLLPPSREERVGFIDALRGADRPIQLRYSGGQGIEAGCGMLAATRSGGREVSLTDGALPHPRIGAGPLPMVG